MHKKAKKDTIYAVNQVWGGIGYRILAMYFFVFKNDSFT